MTMTDPVADFLTRIRNASDAKHEAVDIPSSKLKLELARILKEEGYISNYSFAQNDKQGVIRVQLRYSAGKNPAISSLDRVSRPGCRVYAGKSEIPSVLGGLGICILSTSRGVISDREARQRKLGGEVLCEIW